MNTLDKPKLLVATSHKTEPLFRNYELMVKSLPDLASWWPDMDDFERLHARIVYFSEAWGARHELGDLYRAGRLTPGQETELATLDTELIQHLDEANLCYGLGLPDIAGLFTWGSPLTRSNQILHVPVRPRAL